MSAAPDSRESLHRRAHFEIEYLLGTHRAAAFQIADRRHDQLQIFGRRAFGRHPHRGPKRLNLGVGSSIDARQRLNHLQFPAEIEVRELGIVQRHRQPIALGRHGRGWH